MANCRGVVRSVVNPEGRDPCPFEALWGDWCYFHDKVRQGLVRDYPVGREFKPVTAAGALPAQQEEQEDLLAQMLAEFDA